jgi:hypothetical protein
MINLNALNVSEEQREKWKMVHSDSDTLMS